MVEMEDPSEKLHETIHEHAHEAIHGKGGERWIIFVALSTALVAVLAAITGLMAGHHANEAMVEQIKSSDQWAFYQAKGIKNEILSNTNTILVALGKEKIEENATKVAENKKEQEEIKAKAQEAEAAAEMHLTKHNTLAKGITLFQISIAIAAIAILVKQKLLWVGSLSLSAIALYFLIQGLV